MQKQNEENLPNANRQNWNAEELAEQSTNEESDETLRKVFFVLFLHKAPVNLKIISIFLQAIIYQRNRRLLLCTKLKITGEQFFAHPLLLDS